MVLGFRFSLLLIATLNVIGNRIVQLQNSNIVGVLGSLNYNLVIMDRITVWFLSI